MELGKQLLLFEMCSYCGLARREGNPVCFNCGGSFIKIEHICFDNPCRCTGDDIDVLYFVRSQVERHRPTRSA